MFVCIFRSIVLRQQGRYFMKQKILAVLLAVSMSFLLAACSSGSNSTVDQSDDAESSVSTSDETTSDVGSDGSASSGSYSSSGSSGSGSSDIDPDDYSFEDYLKDNDPDSYEFYQDLEEGWNSGEWDSEDGFVGDDSYSSDDGFED